MLNYILMSTIRSLIEQLANLIESDERSFSNWVKPDLEHERDEFERVAEDERTTANHLMRWAKRGKLVTLDDTTWARLRNTASADPNFSREEAFRYAKLYERDPEPILRGFEQNEPVPAPIVFRRDDGSRHVVAGNTRLMFARVMKVRPKVWEFGYSKLYESDVERRSAERAFQANPSEANARKIISAWIRSGAGFDPKLLYEFQKFDFWKEAVHDFSKKALKGVVDDVEADLKHHAGYRILSSRALGEARGPMFPQGQLWPEKVDPSPLLFVGGPWLHVETGFGEAVTIMSFYKDGPTPSIMSRLRANTGLDNWRMSASVLSRGVSDWNPIEEWSFTVRIFRPFDVVLLGALFS